MEKLTHDILISNGWKENGFYPQAGCYLYKKGEKQVALMGGQAIPFNDTKVGIGMAPILTGVIETQEQLENYVNE